jgi:type I restriction enzyme S subunit
MQSKGAIPFIKIYNLTKTGRLNFSTNPTFVDYETHSVQLRRSKVLPGDVLMNIVGPPLGKVSLVPPKYPEWNTNQAVAIFRPSAGVFPEYLANCLLSETVLFRLTRTAKATVGQVNIALSACRQLPLPVAPTEEQKKLVDQLESSWDSIDRIQAILDETTHSLSILEYSIFHKALHGELIPQDPDDEPASVLLEHIRSRRQATEAQQPRRARVRQRR